MYACMQRSIKFLKRYDYFILSFPFGFAHEMFDIDYLISSLRSLCLNNERRVIEFFRN